MLKKLFGGKSNNGYYLQIDETEKSKPNESNGKAKSSSPVVEETKQVKSVAVEPEKKSDNTPNTSAKTEKPAQTKAVNSNSTKKTSIKNKKTKQASKETITAPVAKSTAPSIDETPFWVKAMYKSNSNGNGAKENSTFATDYLLSNGTQSRHRPGGSMNKFLEMARQAKTPLS
jgi:hypothetical protein